MTEMREWWANVSVVARACVYGESWISRDMAVRVEHAAQFRIHVRLKPEGAPRRYRDERNRRAWETDPEECRSLMRTRYCPAIAISLD